MDRHRSAKQLVARARFTTLILLSFAAAGCKTAPACPLQARTDPGKALDDHANRRSGWQSIKAEARVTQWGRNGRIRGNVLMFLERPNRVRFDVMTQLGPAAVLTSDGESFQLTDLREGVFLHGPTCPRNIARLLGISVDAENVLRILTGDTPTIEATERSMECRDGNYVVTLVAADGTSQEIAFSVDAADRDKGPEAQRLTLHRSAERAPDGKTRWDATYDDYIDVEGRSFPTNVRFVDEVNDADTSVRVKSISVNPEVPEGAFQQAPGPGMSIEFASCS
jgi:outer membrane lipoprotein-sorting protein